MRLLRRLRLVPAEATAESWPHLPVALLIVTACVVARSLVFLVYEQSFFDSDQAIIGLMAKHLIEGRALPLFYYGQIYLLALDAWFAVPFFLVFGPTVFALHLSVVVVNVLAAILLVITLVRWGDLRPLEAALALAFFTFAPPLTAASLIEAGANAWPFAFVPLLWLLRRRPVWFGVVLATGLLYRAFTIYAAVALVAGDVLSRTFFRPARLKRWALACAVTLATWAAVQAMKPYADLMGPGTRGGPLLGASYNQIATVTSRIDFDAAALPARLLAMAGTHLPSLLGGLRTEQAIAAQGHDWLYWLLVVGLPALLVAALVHGGRAGLLRARFGWYLVGVGALSALAFVATRPANEPSERYYLLSIFLPVGITAVSLALNRTRLWRTITIGIVALWCVGSLVDHVAQARRYWGGKVPDDIRQLADGLVDRGITVAIANYWRAYKVTFVAGEKVKVATTEVARIAEYQRLAEEAGPRLVHIREEPCAGGDQIGIWYLCQE